MIPGGIGSLRKRITVEELILVRDDKTGHDVGVPRVIYSDVPASIHSARPSEIWKALQVQTRVTHEVVMRYRSGVTDQCQIRLDGRVFNVVGKPVDDEERHEFLCLTCCEK